MSEAHPAGEAPVRLEDVARAALALSAEPDLDVVVGQFLAYLRSWAAPSAILAAVRAPDTESGWRLLPTLSAGSGPLGVERTLPQLVQEAPEVLERPSFVKPREEVPGVRPRDNCVVPWWHEGRSGLLVLRGVPRPCPPNLPEAVALLSGPLWPRLVGGPADRVETALAQIQRLAESLREEAGRQVERLKAERAAAPPEAAPGHVAALEQALEAARLELQGATAARDDFKARLSEIAKARDELAVGSRASETALGVARRELADVRQEAQRSALELEDFRERVTALEETLRAAEAERDRLRAEAEARPAEAPPSATTVERLESERAEAAEAARAATVERDQAEARARAAEERRHEAEQRRQALEESVHDLRGQLDAAREENGRAAAAAGGGERMPELEAALQAAEEERSRLRREVERLSAERRSEAGTEAGAAVQALEKERGLLEERVRQAEERSRAAERERQAAEDAQTRARQELAEAKQDAQRSTLEVARLTDRLGAVDLALRAAEAERDRLGGEVGRLTARLESLRSDLAAVTEQLEAQRRVAEARAAAPSPVSRAEPPPLPPPATAPPGESSAPTGAVEALRGALSVLRRTPFVPPSLRVAMQEAQAHVEGGGESSRPWLRVVLLDRDAASIEPLAAELEKAGIDTRIANYPEELALLMKTPDARDLHAIVCDVLAFRPDQNVAGLFRSWQKDRPSLALYLSFASDNPAETERAKRVPLSLTAGRFRRPLVREELVDMLTPLARRLESS